MATLQGVWRTVSAITALHGANALRLKTDTPVATRPGVWRRRVNGITGLRSVSILLLGQNSKQATNKQICMGSSTQRLDICPNLPPPPPPPPPFRKSFEYICLSPCLHIDVEDGSTSNQYEIRPCAASLQSSLPAGGDTCKEAQEAKQKYFSDRVRNSDAYSLRGILSRLKSE